jgi:4-hydroxybenzoate polyprenyltransferase
MKSVREEIEQHRAKAKRLVSLGGKMGVSLLTLVFVLGIIYAIKLLAFQKGWEIVPLVISGVTFGLFSALFIINTVIDHHYDRIRRLGSIKDEQ